MNQSLGFRTDQEGKWGYCLRHLLAMYYSGQIQPRIILFFSTGYVVIQAETCGKLELLWKALLAADDDIEKRAAEFGITCITPRPYRPPKEKPKKEGA